MVLPAQATFGQAPTPCPDIEENNQVVCAEDFPEKKAGKAGSTRRVSGHNVFIAERVVAKRVAASDAGMALSYRQALSEAHTEWRVMLPDAKKDWKDRAAKGFETAKRQARAKSTHWGAEEIEYDAVHPKSPWGLGSVSRPCSTEL